MELPTRELRPTKAHVRGLQPVRRPSSRPDRAAVMSPKRPDGPGAPRTVRCCCTAKPSSVIGLETKPTRDHFSCSAVARRLQHATRLQTCGPQASGRGRKEAACACTRWGLPCPVRHRPGRCALTAPLHPYRSKLRRYVFCGTFPDPQRVGGRYPPPCPVVLGLSSRSVSRRAAAPVREHRTPFRAGWHLFGLWSGRSERFPAPIPR